MSFRAFVEVYPRILGLQSKLLHENRRIVHLTFYKSASQWVRDVLTDPEISQVTGFPLSLEGADTTVDGWPVQPPRTFAGPIYGASYDEWNSNAGMEDRAIVVLRDPRDIVISLVFSLGFSHIPSVVTRLLRGPIAAASPRDRVRIGMYLLTNWAERMRSWGTISSGIREYLAMYHALIEDPKKEFSSICHFLNWDIAPPLLHRIIDRHSFERRTGRRPGDVNPYSHRRKGIAGDWRNYFDRELGAEFEASFPGLLLDLRFETTKCWYEMLSAPSDPHGVHLHSPAPSNETLARLAMLEEQSVELDMLRVMAGQRLADNGELTRLVQSLQRQVAEPDARAEQHLEQIEQLTASVMQERSTAEERLADNRRLTGIVRLLQDRLALASTVAADRLADIEKLTAAIGRLENELDTRLADNIELTGIIRSVQAQSAAEGRVSEERLADIERLTAMIHSLERESDARVLDNIELTAIIRTIEGQLAFAGRVSEERLADIDKLTATIHFMERESDKRALDNVELTGVIRSLEGRLAIADRIGEERLADIDKITAMIQSLERESDARVRDNVKLTGYVEELQTQLIGATAEADRRLLDIDLLTAKVRELEARLAEPNTLAEERLADVLSLTALVQRLQTQLAAPNPEMERRLTDIRTLTASVQRLREVLADVKRIADEREAALHELTRCFSYRFGFRPIALIGALFRR